MILHRYNIDKCLVLNTADSHAVYELRCSRLPLFALKTRARDEFAYSSAQSRETTMSAIVSSAAGAKFYCFVIKLETASANLNASIWLIISRLSCKWHVKPSARVIPIALGAQMETFFGAPNF
jgi:hypothetical protein